MTDRPNADAPRTASETANETAKEEEQVSFPARKLLETGYLQGRVLDFGCGTGADVRFLKANGVDVVGFDPQHAPEWPDGPFDTILCLFVLDALSMRERASVLMDVAHLLDPSGAAFYALRRGPDATAARRRAGAASPEPITLPFESIVRTSACEIYRYRPYPQVERVDTPDCVFCDPSPERTLLTESATAYALLDRDPVTPGHALVLPKRHVEGFFALSEHEQRACWLMVDRVQALLQKRHQPDGFNVGFSAGPAAGQSVTHTHIHIIPRYNSDPSVGGLRNVVLGQR